MGVISKYHRLVLPGKKTVGRDNRAAMIKHHRRKQKSGAGPNVRSSLIKTIGKKVSTLRQKEKLGRLKATSHSTIVGGGLKKKPRFAALKPKSVVAGAGVGGRKPSGKKLDMLRTVSHNA